MIVPSIDLRAGRAVQLRQGREFLFDGGDPLDRLAEFAVAGEVAVVDLDAALGTGSNRELILEMIRRSPCRVGGGIRSLDQALDWLDAGATRVVIGTAASPDFCAQLPRERVIAAVDADRGRVVVDGWRTATGRSPLEAIAELAPFVNGFLFTQVEHEGGLAGFDVAALSAVAEGAGRFGVRVTAAGGISRPEEVEALDAMGVDAQVGVALYRGVLSLGDAIAAPLTGDGPWPTVVCDSSGRALGLVWSTRESLALAVAERRGIYWSRSRRSLWRKGETSGAVQELLRVDLDCDRDALRFTVRQQGTGFCHRGTRACWDGVSGFAEAEAVIRRRLQGPTAPAEPIESGTRKLAADPALLRAKLLEEAAELADATTRDEVVREAADLLYMSLVALHARGAELEPVEAELVLRGRRVRRRPMAAKAIDAKPEAP